MRDPWVRIVSEHLSDLDLPDDDRTEVIEEVAAHLRECAEELEREGATDAVARTLAEVPDWLRLAANIRRAKEERMSANGTGTAGRATDRIGTRTLAFVVTVAVILGGAAGLVTSWTTPVRYRSSATIQVSLPKPSGADNSGNLQPLSASLQSTLWRILNRPRLEGLVEEFNLYPAMRASKIMEELVEQFRQDISIVAVQPDVINIRYVGSDPTTTMKVTEKLAAFIKDEGQVDAERSGRGALFTLLDQARVPEKPLGLTRLQRVGTGAAAGLAAGLLIALALAFVRFPSSGRPEPQTA
jgi:hypothetical protein